MDILHWHANSVIGAASGMEHPTVLHLHLARVVLLTPFGRILRLAEFLSGDADYNPLSLNLGETDNEKEKEIRETKNYIKRWATEDQHKARLAIIHAGALFWHVRRFSIDAFYEAEAVYLATLALWAYGLFAEHTSRPLTSRPSNSCTVNEHNHTNNNANEDRNKARGRGEEDGEEDCEEEDDDDEQINELYPTSMQLDRPADDELVQLFVKRGQGMKALVMGVGNLCAGRRRR